MLETVKTKGFARWAARLKGREAKQVIGVCIRMIQLKGELYGDWKSLGEGLVELRFSRGPGYRVYVAFWRNVVLLLLAGGDKSTQASDIKKARRALDDWRRAHEDRV